MKKITLALVLLLVTGLVAVSAQELTATVSGSATATIGFDIDEGTFGMKNAATSDVSLTLVSGDFASEAADGWYGMVSLTGMKINFDHAGGADYVTWSDGDDDDDAISAFAEFGTADSGLNVVAPTVAAKITDGTTYIQIYALDKFSVGQAAEVEDDKSKISVEGTTTDLGTDLSDGSGGITFGTVVGPAAIKVHFNTISDWTGTTAENTQFLVGSDITLSGLGPAAITLEVVRGLGVDETLGVGFKTALTGLGPLAATIAADMEYATTFAYEARLDLDLTFGDIGASIDAFYDADDLDVEISSSPTFGPLGLKLLIGLYDLSATLKWGIDVGTTFTLNDMMKATLDVAYDSAGVVPVTLSFVVTNPIPNVVITAKWTTDNVTADANLGLFTAETKVSY